MPVLKPKAAKKLKKGAKAVKSPKAAKVAKAPKAPGASSATKTATATKTSTDAYTQGNITITGGAGKGATIVKIGLPGGSLANNSKKPSKARESTKVAGHRTLSGSRRSGPRSK